MLQSGGAWSGVRAVEMLEHMASLHAQPLDTGMLVERLGLVECGRTPGRTCSMPVTMWSTKPYALAPSASNQRSRRESRSTVAMSWPVSSATRLSTVSRVCRRSSAWMAMSIAVPPMPADPWCSSTFECGRA